MPFVAAGKVVVVMLTGVAAAALTVTFKVAVAELLVLLVSTTLTANDRVVALVEVPADIRRYSENPETAVVNDQV